MSHPNNSIADKHSMPSLDALRVEAESLRQRIGQENVNQSSVLASRRLDEALLRLDRAAGRRRDDHRGRRNGNDRGPSERRASDLELDESIAQSSSLWFEASDSERTRYRFDEPESELRQTPPHVMTPPKAKPEAPKFATHEIETPAPEAPVPDAAQTDQAKTSNAESTAPRATKSSLAALFSGPIDVMSSAELVDEAEPATPSKLDTNSSIAEPDQPLVLAEQVQVAGEASLEAYEEHQLVEQSTLGPFRDLPSIDAAKPSPASELMEEPGASLESEAQGSVEPLADGKPNTNSATKSDISPEPAAQPQQNVKSKEVELKPFQASWQLDEFIVPPIVDELFLAGSIATQLASRLADARADGLRSIAVTSAKPGEGRSTVAIGMALSVAFSGLRVAVVDADPRGVKLATDLQLDLDNSWLDTVRTGLPLEEAAVYSDADSLTLIPLLGRDDEVSIDSRDLHRLLGKLQTCFDLVIVDCGASAVSDVALCDTALIVRDVHRTKAVEVETLSRLLRRSGVQGIGVIENFCEG